MRADRSVTSLTTPRGSEAGIGWSRDVPGDKKILRHLALQTLIVLLLGACETIPDDAFRLTESTLKHREIQTRQYEDVTDIEILSASAAVLQDLGYTIDEVEKELGVLSASKRADAKDTMETAGMIALDVADCLVTFFIGCEDDAYKSTKDVQDIKLTLVVLPKRDKDRTYSARITIQRVVWARSGLLYQQETIHDAEVYQAFFDKLSKSVFLEKQGV